jgi:hypothetical protein
MSFRVVSISGFFRKLFLLNMFVWNLMVMSFLVCPIMGFGNLGSLSGYSLVLTMWVEPFLIGI